MSRLHAESLRLLTSDPSLDYDALESELAIRMPSKQHDVFIAQVSKHISSGLQRLETQSGAIADWAKNIFSSSTTDIHTTLKGDDDQISKHSPDASWSHVDAKHPGLVLEVSFSQKGKDLVRLANNYILGTNEVSSW